MQNVICNDALIFFGEKIVYTDFSHGHKTLVSAKPMNKLHDEWCFTELHSPVKSDRPQAWKPVGIEMQKDNKNIAERLTDHDHKFLCTVQI